MNTDSGLGIKTSASIGTVTSMMTFIGLHALHNEERYVPTLVSEYKRRIFGQIFVLDKMGVSFSGRPPLSRRFCTTPMPLDISDVAWLGGREAIDRAVQALDSNGWNTSGGLHPSTMTRARILIANIRDELVDVAISHGIEVSNDHLL
jgi:hypothetical protein